MNVIRKIVPLLFLLACGTNNPKELAGEYCDCFNEGLSDPERMNECAEMVKSHKEKLSKDPEKTKKYTEEILRCAIYEKKD